MYVSDLTLCIADFAASVCTSEATRTHGLLVTTLVIVITANGRNMISEGTTLKLK
jgi:hypothetical protein